MIDQHAPTSLRAEHIGIAEWRSLVNRSFVPLEVSPLGEPFTGTLGLRVVDEVAVFEVDATPHLVRRTPELIAASDQAYYKLSLQIEGNAQLTQDGRTAEIRPGNLAIYDTTRPYSLAFQQHNRAFIIMFPHGVVELPRPSVAEVTAVVFSRESALGRVIIPFLQELGANIELLEGTNGTKLVHSALDLLVTLLSSELHVDTDPRRRLAHDVREYIDARLGDATMNPASIAKAHFVSTRYLHAAFSAEGVTLAAWIRERRLERIRRELGDPQHSNESLHHVASRWGLHDAAHFSKLFRARFGETPSEYRRRVLTEATP